MTTHIMVNNDTTFCGKTMSELIKTDPHGSTFQLVCSSYLSEPVLLQMHFDKMADQSDCPACKRGYYRTSDLADNKREADARGIVGDYLREREGKT